MKKPKILKTPFSDYDVVKCIGQGGNGYVYEIVEDDRRFAAKVLNISRASKEKLKRFENEYRFCAVERHANIIRVLEYGLSEEQAPFFTMPLYECSLRHHIGKLNEDQSYNLLLQLLDGLEAAHKFEVIHRDLKPENILCCDKGESLVLADFGIADFCEEELYTAVETEDGTRLANFQYAAPEQRMRGRVTSYTTDIYSLGLIVNELFSGELPLGKDHKAIGDSSEKYSYLDPVVEKMLQQNPDRRYQSVEDIKLEISSRSKDYISSLKISALKNTAIPEAESDDPISAEPMRIIDVEWENGELKIHLNHHPTPQWRWALLNMGGHTAVYGKGPEVFRFSGNLARVLAEEHEAQRVINHFKEWMPKADRVYLEKLRQDAENEFRRKLKEKEDKIAAEERRKRINTNLSF